MLAMSFMFTAIVNGSTFLHREQIACSFSFGSEKQMHTVHILILYITLNKMVFLLLWRGHTWQGGRFSFIQRGSNANFLGIYFQNQKKVALEKRKLHFCSWNKPTLDL